MNFITKYIDRITENVEQNQEEQEGQVQGSTASFFEASGNVAGDIANVRQLQELQPTRPLENLDREIPSIPTAAIETLLNQTERQESRPRPPQILIPRKSGLKNVFVDTSQFVNVDAASINNYFTKNYNAGNELPDYSTNDKFRFSLRKFWYQFDDNSSDVFSKGFNQDPYVPFEIFVDESSTTFEVIDSGIRTETRITLKPNPKDFRDIGFSGAKTAEPRVSQVKWRSYLEGGTAADGNSWEPILDFDSDFFDHVFTVSVPRAENVSKNEKYAVAFEDYNYYNEIFENVLRTGVLEQTMPNIYTYYAQVNNPENISQKISSVNTLNGTLQNVFKKLDDGDGLSVRDYNQLLDEWSLKRNSVPDISNVVRLNSSIVLTSDDIIQDLYKQVGENENLFPMSIRLEMYSDSIGAMKQILETSRISRKVTDYIVKTEIQYRFDNRPVMSYPFVRLQEGLAASNHQSKIYDLETFLNVVLPEIDVPAKTVKPASEPAPVGEQFVLRRRQEEESGVKTLVSNKYKKSSQVPSQVPSRIPQPEEEEWTPTIQPNKYFIRLDAIEDTAGETIQNTLAANSISKLIFKNKINKLINANLRKYSDMIDGVPSYNDTILYRIDKHRVFENGPELVPIQSFYIPAINGQEVLKFIDTQVKYNRTYAYKIFAYDVVVGTKYKYEKINNAMIYDTNGSVSFNVIQEPSVKIIESPYYEFSSLRVLDKPPTPPHIQVIPYLGNNTKIMFSLETSYGELRQAPQIILSSDESIIDRYKIDVDGTVLYDGDDKIVQFQVYKLENAPISINDFSQAQVFELDNSVPDRFKGRTRETSFVDYLVPNRKYYFAFRALDVHGNISNLTTPIEVEIVDNGGVIYTRSQAYDFPDRSLRSASKKFRKYVHIMASINQTDITNVTKAEELITSNLGSTALDNVWGKKFKFRITSNSTGRKIEIIVRMFYDVKSYEFTYNGVTSVVEADSFSEALQMLLIEHSVDLF